jgi:homoserine kinase
MVSVSRDVRSVLMCMQGMLDFRTSCHLTGAGLGGGSGNAATALWAANQLTGQPASNAQLLAWSGEIGSDISVFFSQGAAYCTGR